MSFTFTYQDKVYFTDGLTYSVLRSVAPSAVRLVLSLGLMTKTIREITNA